LMKPVKFTGENVVVHLKTLVSVSKMAYIKNKRA